MEVKENYVKLNLSYSQRKLLERGGLLETTAGVFREGGRLKVEINELAEFKRTLERAQSTAEEADPATGSRPKEVFGQLVLKVEGAISAHQRAFGKSDGAA